MLVTMFVMVLLCDPLDLEAVPLIGLSFYLVFIIIIVSVCNKTDNLI